jgi:hypothetical protein
MPALAPVLNPDAVEEPLLELLSLERRDDEPSVDEDVGVLLLPLLLFPLTCRVAVAVAVTVFPLIVPVALEALFMLVALSRSDTGCQHQ